MKVGRHGGQQADKKRKHVTECIMDSIKFISGREIQPGRLTDSEKEEELIETKQRNRSEMTVMPQNDRRHAYHSFM